MMEPIILPGEGPPIHSARQDFLFLRGSAPDASTDHFVLAGVINLALPINLLDGLRWGAVFIVFWYIPLEDQFPFFFPSVSQLIVGFSSVGSFA
jgi:hypothetical protein